MERNEPHAEKQESCSLNAGTFDPWKNEYYENSIVFRFDRSGHRKCEKNQNFPPDSVKMDDPQDIFRKKALELENREQHLDERVAQFESLVQKTKRSFQEERDELSRRENDLGAQCLQIEREKLEIREEKTRLNDYLAQREKEIMESLQEYRADLEQQLEVHLLEYQQRYEKKCREYDLHCGEKIQRTTHDFEEQRQKMTLEFQTLLAEESLRFESEKTEWELRLLDGIKERENETHRQLQIREEQLEQERLELKLLREELEFQQEILLRRRDELNRWAKKNRGFLLQREEEFQRCDAVVLQMLETIGAEAVL